MWATTCNASAGDLILVMAGEARQTRKALSALRLHVAEILGLRKPDVFDRKVYNGMSYFHV